VGVTTLICRGISALSTYYKGSRRGDKFRDYVRDFMDLEFKKATFGGNAVRKV
jgi:hypothetical protein